MSFKPASDWIDAFPEEPNEPSRPLPPAHVRTRKAPDPSSKEPSGHNELPPTPVQSEPAPTNAESSQAISSETAAYAVGYGKPPRHSQFQPGRSGNPRGRPKGAKSLNTLVRETLSGKVSVRTATGTKRISRIEAVIQKTVEQAMKGNTKAQAELIKLWRSAVPDEKLDEAVRPEEDLTAADLAMLALYRNGGEPHEEDQP